MTESLRWFAGALHPLDEEECWEYLVQERVGRVALADPAGPLVLPVAYAARAGRIWFRTAEDGLVAERALGSRMTFQIDYAEPFNHAGWSVLVRGRANRVTPEDLQVLGSDDLPEPWPEDPRTLSVSIVADEVTGRRLVPQ